MGIKCKICKRKPEENDAKAYVLSLIKCVKGGNTNV